MQFLKDGVQTVGLYNGGDFPASVKSNDRLFLSHAICLNENETVP